jgi:hypothetical protein
MILRANTITRSYDCMIQVCQFVRVILLLDWIITSVMYTGWATADISTVLSTPWSCAGWQALLQALLHLAPCLPDFRWAEEALAACDHRGSRVALQ